MARAVAVTSDDLTPTKERQKAATRQRGVYPSADLVPMQFRMPEEFATAFRVAAAERKMKYNELFEACFQHYIKS